MTRLSARLGIAATFQRYRSGLYNPGAVNGCCSKEISPACNLVVVESSQLEDLLAACEGQR